MSLKTVTFFWLIHTKTFQKNTLNLVYLTYVVGPDSLCFSLGDLGIWGRLGRYLIFFLQRGVQLGKFENHCIKVASKYFFFYIYLHENTSAICYTLKKVEWIWTGLIWSCVCCQQLLWDKFVTSVNLVGKGWVSEIWCQNITSYATIHRKKGPDWSGFTWVVQEWFYKFIN